MIPAQPSSLSAVILAGGKSSRMGTDKALLRLGSTTLLERICALTATSVAATWVIAASDEQCATLRLDGANVIQDEPEFRGCGPLAGIYTGLRRAHSNAVCFLTCDMPFVDSTILQHLASHHDAASDVTCFKGESHHHEPFPGIFEKHLLPSLRDKLERNELSLCRYLDQIATHYLSIPSGCTRVFTNTNTPREFDDAVSQLTLSDAAAS
jgi:molybdopterin-guanine dinucleotide biosynthesis protein A